MLETTPQQPITTTELDATAKAILRANGHAVDGGWIAPYLTDQANSEARAVLEAAGVPKMLADRERIGMALFTNGYDAGYTTDGAVEVIEMMAARIAELEASLNSILRHTDPDGEDGTYRGKRGR